MRPDMAGEERCECVVWRDQERRCELWRVQGTDRLRPFDGEVLVTHEAVLHGALWAQVLALRTWTPRRRRVRAFGVVPGDSPGITDPVSIEEGRRERQEAPVDVVYSHVGDETSHGENPAAVLVRTMKRDAGHA